MKLEKLRSLKVTMLAAVVVCAIAASGKPVEEQVKSCFVRQYEEQLRQFTIPHQIMVSNLRPDGDDGYYTADVLVQIEPTSTVYKVIIEPKGETTWTTPHIDDDIDEALLPASKRDEMNAKIQRFILTDFTVVAPVEQAELGGYLKSVARFKVDFPETDNATVVGSDNEGKISFSGVRFFELHSTADVSSERVFVAGTKEYENGKKRHFKKRRDIGTACASINENAGFVRALRIMATNSTAVADDVLSMYTRDMETPRLRSLRERSRSIRAEREDEVLSMRRRHKKKHGVKESVEEDVNLAEEMKVAMDKRHKELGEVNLQIVQERKSMHDAIRKDPRMFVEEPRARFEKSVRDFNSLVK